MQYFVIMFNILQKRLYTFFEITQFRLNHFFHFCMFIVE